MIGVLRSCFLGRKQAYQIGDVVQRQLGLFFVNTPAMLRVHSENADVVERVHDIGVVDVGGDSCIVDQFQQGGILRFFSADFAVNKVYSIFQKLTT